MEAEKGKQGRRQVRVKIEQIRSIERETGEVTSETSDSRPIENSQIGGREGKATSESSSSQSIENSNNKLKAENGNMEGGE